MQSERADLAWQRYPHHNARAMASHNAPAHTPAIAPRRPFRDAQSGMFIPQSSRQKNTAPAWGGMACERCVWIGRLRGVPLQQRQQGFGVQLGADVTTGQQAVGQVTFGVV